MSFVGVHFDGDGLVALFVANYNSANHLYRNNGVAGGFMSWRRMAQGDASMSKGLKHMMNRE